jgi:hypothetical protein
MAGGESARAGIESETTALLCKFTPVPTSVPSRPGDIEDTENARDWFTAADYREISARMYLNIGTSCRPAFGG